MNKQQLFMAGSALLATTSLAGVAQAGVVSTAAGVSSGTAVGGTTFSGVKIGNTIFSATAATANAVQIGTTSIYIAFSNIFTPTTKFSVEVDPINASFVTAGMSANLILGSVGTFATSVAAVGNCNSVTPLTTKIILDNCGALAGTNGLGADTSANFAGIQLTGVKFNNASGLAAVGGTVGVSGFVYNPTNAASVYENITAGNVVSSVSPIVTTVTAGATVTVLASSTPVAFAYFDSATDYRTAVLASVNITGVGAYDKDLTTILSGLSTPAAGSVSALSSINVTVTSSALSQAAVTSVSARSIGGTVAIFNGSVANFSAGVATFGINVANGYDSFQIQVSFSGTAAISAASAGTVTVVHGSGQGNVVTAVPAVTGKTGSISLGGFSAELNTFLSSTNASFSSFARIHNNGIVAAVATVTVKNDGTGATLGTYTSASIATGQTLQISAKDIETGAGITAAAGLNYTLNINGAFSGYAQHIIFNPATGQLADLSAFRNHDKAGGATSP